MALQATVNMENYELDGADPATYRIDLGYHVCRELVFSKTPGAAFATFQSYEDQDEFAARGFNAPQGGFSVAYFGQLPDSADVWDWMERMVIANRGGFGQAEQVA